MKSLPIKDLIRSSAQSSHLRPIHHRSCGWRPLIGEEDKKPEWVTHSLLPQLNRETGVSWKKAGANLLHTEECQLFLPELDNKDWWKRVRNHNPIVDTLKKLYPVIEPDELGYCLIDTDGCDKEGMWHYRGFWALNTESIIKRGSIVGQKFGL
jgi:hypothetical protein